MSKPKIAVSWNASCGGCDESIVDIEDRILDVASMVEFVLWPCAMDFKYEDVEAMKDGEIHAALINGGIQNTHQEKIVKMLRKKSKFIIAYGSCAWLGGVPSLVNLKSREGVFRNSYLEMPSNDNPGGIMPETKCTVDGHELELPEIFESLLKLDDVIDVDYYLPGCPPTPKMIIGALEALLGGMLPEKGAVLAPDKALCTSCDRNATKPEKIMLTGIKRIHQIVADPEQCFLNQSVLCMGPATRDGCDFPCVRGNMPCTGCMGPMKDGDQGARMISSLGGIIDGTDEAGADKILDGIADPAGTFYRYSTAASFLGRRRGRNS